MDGQIVERFLSSGLAFVPVNAEGKGDTVLLYWKDGSTEVLMMQCGAYLAQMLHYFGTSVAANRNRYGNLVGKKQLVPIILSYGITLIPYNVREPIGKQTRVGWFLSREIQSFRKKGHNQTSIVMPNHSVEVMHSEKFCFEQLKNARCIELCYGEIHEPHRKNWLFSAG